MIMQESYKTEQGIWNIARIAERPEQMMINRIKGTPEEVECTIRRLLTEIEGIKKIPDFELDWDPSFGWKYIYVKTKKVAYYATPEQGIKTSTPCWTNARD